MASKTPNRFSPEVRTLAVRLVFEPEKDHSSRWATVTSIAAKIGCTAQTLHQWVGRAERDSGRNQGRMRRTGIRPIEASKTAVCYVHNTSISLKKSEIEQLRKSRFRMRRVTSADSPYGRAFRNVADRKTGQSAEPLRNFASRLPAVS